jgi:hypothetical protein
MSLIGKLLMSPLALNLLLTVVLWITDSAKERQRRIHRNV